MRANAIAKEKAKALLDGRFTDAELDQVASQDNSLVDNYNNH